MVAVRVALAMTGLFAPPIERHKAAKALGLDIPAYLARFDANDRNAASILRTTRLDKTAEMFRAVFANVRAYLDDCSQAITSSALLSGGNTG
jgi:hypothetical protein